MLLECIISAGCMLVKVHRYERCYVGLLEYGARELRALTMRKEQPATIVHLNGEITALRSNMLV
jgi:hypothetical protein